MRPIDRLIVICVVGAALGCLTAVLNPLFQHRSRGNGESLLAEAHSFVQTANWLTVEDDGIGELVIHGQDSRDVKDYNETLQLGIMQYRLLLWMNSNTDARVTSWNVVSGNGDGGSRVYSRNIVAKYEKTPKVKNN